MLSYKIIVNPSAGRGDGERLIPFVEQKLHTYKLDYDIVRTERPWHAAELAQQAVKAGYKVVVAMGGDGTSNEVINGLMQAKDVGLGAATMGVLCVGQGNDFAYSMGVPTDLTEGCQSLAQDQRRIIDIGQVKGGLYPQGRYFGNGVGIGFDAVVGFEALKMKRLHGFISYLVAALKTIFLYYKAPMVHIEYNEQSFNVPALMVSTMNGIRLGGGFMMAPQGKSNDGLFDLCIAEQVSRPQIFALIPRFMQGTQATHPAIKTAQTQRISVTAIQGVLPAHADGETLCIDGEKLIMELLPHQLEIVSQAQKEV